MISYGAVILMCATVVCVMLFVASIVQSRPYIDSKEKDRQQRIDEKNSSHRVDRRKLDTKCDICFGEYGDETIKVCDCGKTFHVECADATAECPYCKRSNKTMKTRSAIKTVCPTCGRLIENNICECGTVMPDKDGTYECRCGERISVSSKNCPKCGSSLRVEIGK